VDHGAAKQLRQPAEVTSSTASAPCAGRGVWGERAGRSSIRRSRGLEGALCFRSRQRERPCSAHAFEPRRAEACARWYQASAARTRPLVPVAGRVAAADAGSLGAHPPTASPSFAAALLARGLPAVEARMAPDAQQRRASGRALCRKRPEGLVAVRQGPRVEGCNLHSGCPANRLSLLLGAPRGARTITGCAAAGSGARVASREERRAHSARGDADEQQGHLVALRRLPRARMASGGG